MQSRGSLAVSYLRGRFELVICAADALEGSKYSVSNYRKLPFSWGLTNLSPVILPNQHFSHLVVPLLIFFASSTIIIKMIFLGQVIKKKGEDLIDINLGLRDENWVILMLRWVTKNY
jgi:hypothetical protein